MAEGYRVGRFRAPFLVGAAGLRGRRVPVSVAAVAALTITVFILTYIGMAAGRVPGLRLDRSGIALIAAVVLVALGSITPEQIAGAIHFPTVILLFALMIVSARFAGAGFYDFCAAWIAEHRGSATTLLALTVAVGGALSAVLVNDVVVFVMTPLLCTGLLRRGPDPRPFLAALAGASNAGSAATIIGNPQNIVIGQVGGLHFATFTVVCGIPALLALVIVFLCVRFVWSKQLKGVVTPRDAAALPHYDRPETLKAAVATMLLLAMFLTPLSREMAALLVASVLLMSRRFSSRDMLTSVDWPLLLLFVGLFVVNGAVAETGLTADVMIWLAEHGWLPDRLSLMAPMALVASNTVGNVPTVVMLLTVWRDIPEGALYALALLTTFAGNFFLVGSIANLIVAERAAHAGVRFGFIDQARAGVPMTIVSMAVAIVWLQVGGWLDW
jgi:Na+/H+ antiporter NhaD/arsenite permease-like protein